MQFNGPDYHHGRDSSRLTVQYTRIFELMKDGAWRTLPDIESVTGDPAASISAQLRHMRKARFGSNTVLRTYRGNGLFAYRLVVNPLAGLESVA